MHARSWCLGGGLWLLSFTQPKGSFLLCSPLPRDAQGAAGGLNPSSQQSNLPPLTIKYLFSAETPKELLAGSLLTPNDLFYVRNHLPVPHIKPEEYRLKIEGEGLRSVRRARCL